MDRHQQGSNKLSDDASGTGASHEIPSNRLVSDAKTMNSEGVSESESSATSFNNPHAGLEGTTPYGLRASLTATSPAELEARAASEGNESNRSSSIHLDHNQLKWGMGIRATPPKDSDLATESGSIRSHPYSFDFESWSDYDGGELTSNASTGSKITSRQSDKRLVLRSQWRPPPQRLSSQQPYSTHHSHSPPPGRTSSEHEKKPFANIFQSHSNHGPSDATAILPSKGLSDIYCIAKLNRVEWLEFRHLRTLLRFRKFGYVIDILAGEPTADGEQNGYPASERSTFQYVDRFKAATTRMDEERGPKTFHPVQGALPERIRINSRKIINYLKNGIGQGFTSLNDRQPLVIVRPFRALVHYEAQIRNYCNTLEQKCAHFTDVVKGTEAGVVDGQSQAGSERSKTTGKESTGSDQTRVRRTEKSVSERKFQESRYNLEKPGHIMENALPPTSAQTSSQRHPREPCHDFESERDTDQTDDLETMRHLRCLLSFIDEDINARLRYLDQEKPMKITFPDAWYIFKPGDEIIQSHRRQAYRVLAVTSTGHKFVTPRNQLRTRIYPEAIVLLCVCIDFDGYFMGPVQHEFEIPRFDGEKLVTSLSVYPLRFDGNFKTRETFLERGKLFLRCTSIRHMHYTGLVASTQQELDGPVVIDFEETFRQEDWRPEIEDVLWARLDASSGERCRADCCGTENVLDDAFVEQIQNDDYMTKLMKRSPTKPGTDALPTLALYSRSLSELNSDETPITDDEYLIMSDCVFGFDLHNRKWRKFETALTTPRNTYPRVFSLSR